MTPAARIASAIDILDNYLEGESAEKLLTTWARQNRYAGSKDRAAVRDHVFEALRNLRSFAALGGGKTGRAIMVGALRSQGENIEDYFTGEGYAPEPLSEEELAGKPEPSRAVALDCPEWLEPMLKESLGDDFEEVLISLKSRAAVFLRVNLRKGSVENAIALLQEEDIESHSHPLSPTALEVTKNPRRVQNSHAYRDGFVELQDAASQFVTDHIEIPQSGKVLDFCAGGGGKSLALAARADASFFAYDISADRMKDVRERSDRAEVVIEVCDEAMVENRAPFDVVLCDVPCSGSGSWRRAPEGKWALTQEKLDDLNNVQLSILKKTSGFVAPSGTLAYVTCSMLNAENQQVVDRFLSTNSEWRKTVEHVLTPKQGGDGFYMALLTKKE